MFHHFDIEDNKLLVPSVYNVRCCENANHIVVSNIDEFDDYPVYQVICNNPDHWEPNSYIIFKTRFTQNDQFDFNGALTLAFMSTTSRNI